MAARRWTPEQREAQAAAIRRWRPWESATGPKTDAGKHRVSRNPYKGGQRAELRALARALREHQRGLSDLISGL